MFTDANGFLSPRQQAAVMLTCNAQTVQVVKFPLAKGYLHAPIIIIIGSYPWVSLADVALTKIASGWPTNRPLSCQPFQNGTLFTGLRTFAATGCHDSSRVRALSSLPLPSPFIVERITDFPACSCSPDLSPEP